jgi:hypothetical protein
LALHGFSKSGFVFEVATHVSPPTFVCDQYLHFIAAAAGYPVSHKQNVAVAISMFAAVIPTFIVRS